jgi:hypothetical protein
LLSRQGKIDTEIEQSILPDAFFGTLGFDETIGVILPTVFPGLDSCSSNIHGNKLCIKNRACQAQNIFYGTTKVLKNYLAVIALFYFLPFSKCWVCEQFNNHSQKVGLREVIHEQKVTVQRGVKSQRFGDSV